MGLDLRRERWAGPRKSTAVSLLKVAESSHSYHFFISRHKLHGLNSLVGVRVSPYWDSSSDIINYIYMSVLSMCLQILIIKVCVCVWAVGG